MTPFCIRTGNRFFLALAPSIERVRADYELTEDLMGRPRGSVYSIKPLVEDAEAMAELRKAAKNEWERYRDVKVLF